MRTMPCDWLAPPLPIGLTKIRAPSSSTRSTAEAYTYALAEEDLEGALENIDEAIQMVGRGASPELLDTRAYVNYLLGEYESGLVDAEAALESYDEVRRVERNRWRQSARMAIDSALGNTPFRTSIRHWPFFTNIVACCIGLLGREEESEQDLQRAAELGYQPENGVW